MELESLSQGRYIERASGKFGEETEFNRAEQGLRSTESSTELHDLRRSQPTFGH